MSVTSGVAEYNLPADIYAHKIRKIFIDNGSDKYEIRRIRMLQNTVDVDSSEELRYVIMNTLSGGAKIKFFPAPDFTDSTSITIWFIRNARNLAQDSDLMDLPEAAQFVIQAAKVRCYEKEGHPQTEAAKAERGRLQAQLVDTLQSMVPDENNMAIPDMSFYDEFDTSYTKGW